MKDVSALHDRFSIAYVAQTFPALTQTFVYREVQALERRGLDISTFAIWKPKQYNLSQESRYLVDQTFYVMPASWLKFLKAHLQLIFKYPRRYFSTAFFVLTRKGESPRNRIRTLFHFAEAVVMAVEMKKQGIRHVHAHFSINAASAALIISRLLQISYSFTAHNILFTDRLLLKDKVRTARFVVAISEYTRQYLLRQTTAESWSHKVHIVHCGLESHEFRPPRHKIQNKIPIILFLAQLTERKGGPVLLQACKILREQGLAFKCIIGGDGPKKNEMETFVSDHGMHQCIQMVGRVFQEGIRDYLGRADIFVLPCITAENGDKDGIPVCLMEAMAMEVPTVSTYVSGIPELIADGHDGLLVKEKDPIALADILRRLLRDKKLRIILGKNGREKVLKKFDVDRNAEKLKKLMVEYL